MLTYFNLVLSILPIDVDLILSKLWGLHRDKYEVIETKTIDDGERCVFRFTSGYVEDYRKMWIDRYGGRFYLLDLTAKALQDQFFTLELYSSGLVRITCSEVDLGSNLERQHLLRELRFHLNAFYIHLRGATKNLGYTLVTTAEHGFSILKENGEFVELAKHINNQMEPIYKTERKSISQHVENFSRRFEGSIGPFVTQPGFSDWHLWYKSTVRVLRLIEQLEGIIERVSTFGYIAGELWKRKAMDFRILRDYFSRIAEHSKFVMDIYSNQYGLIGICVTIITFGIAFLSFALSTVTSAFGNLSIIISVGAMITGVIMWKRSKAKDLVLGEIELVKELLS